MTLPIFLKFKSGLDVQLVQLQKELWAVDH